MKKIALGCFVFVSVVPFAFAHGTHLNVIGGHTHDSLDGIIQISVSPVPASQNGA